MSGSPFRPASDALWRVGGAGAQAVEDAQRTLQLPRPRARQHIEPLGAVAALWRGIAVAMADKLATPQAIEHGVEHAQRKRVAVCLDLLLDRQCIGLPPAAGDRQHHELLVGCKHWL